MRKKRRIIAIVAIVAIIVIAAAIIKFWPDSKKVGEVKIINKIDAYGYVLEDDETSLHKGYFNELVNVLKAEDIDEEAYAKLVVELFVSDFYNLDNKPTKNDVGGIQYIYTATKDNMVLKAKDTIYKYVENNLDNTRKQELPVVSDITIEDIKTVSYKYGGKTDKEAYEVTIKWSYKKDLEYQDTATITLVHEDKKLSIAELK